MNEETMERLKKYLSQFSNNELSQVKNIATLFKCILTLLTALATIALLYLLGTIGLSILSNGFNLSILSKCFMFFIVLIFRLSFVFFKNIISKFTLYLHSYLQGES